MSLFGLSLCACLAAVLHGRWVGAYLGASVEHKIVARERHLLKDAHRRLDRVHYAQRGAEAVAVAEESDHLSSGAGASQQMHVRSHCIWQYPESPAQIWGLGSEYRGVQNRV